ncbi:peptidylprolyl isomerase [Magnetovibrio sp.]|uniref:peptidylprolyl isomerase n=1 Tax=Magnetovibrio sp. TaxID=2024836 RepID=UPI002F94B452
MRIAILAALACAIAAGAWFALSPSSSVSPASVYQGAGETNLDLQSADNVVYLDLPAGRVVIEMRPDLAPKHVARIKELVRAGFYDGLTFHRVIEDFMAQTGDPLGNGTGGSGVNLPGEFSGDKFVRGVVGMARARDVDSADSQFFIMLGNGRWLDGKYTVWGHVVEGMEFVDALKKGDKNANGKISGEPDKIVRMHIKADQRG